MPRSIPSTRFGGDPTEVFASCSTRFIIWGSRQSDLIREVIAFAISSRRAVRNWEKLLSFHNSGSSGMKCAFRISFVVSFGRYCHGGMSAMAAFFSRPRNVRFAMSFTVAFRAFRGDFPQTDSCGTGE